MPHRPAQGETAHQGSDLSGEHRFGDAGQLLLACLFVTVWAADSFFLKKTTYLNHYVPITIRIPAGIVLLTVSGYLAWRGLYIVFGEKREKPGVIRASVFGVVRHPIYLSEILLYLGLLIMSLSLAAACICCIVIMFLHYISRYEEKLLLARFGAEYQQYMNEVPMWIPWLRKKEMRDAESAE